MIKTLLLISSISGILNSESLQTLEIFNNQVVPKYESREKAVDGARILAREFRSVAENAKSGVYPNTLMIAADLRARYELVGLYYGIKKSFLPIRERMEAEGYKIASSGEGNNYKKIATMIDNVAFTLEKIQ